MIDIIAHLKAVEVGFGSDPVVPEDYLERQRARLMLLDQLETARKRQLAGILVNGDNCEGASK